METKTLRATLKVFSIISIVLGGFAILGSLEGGVDAEYAFLGGAFFVAEGWLALAFISKH